MDFMHVHTTEYEGLIKIPPDLPVLALSHVFFAAMLVSGFHLVGHQLCQERFLFRSSPSFFDRCGNGLQLSCFYEPSRSNIVCS